MLEDYQFYWSFWRYSFWITLIFFSLIYLFSISLISPLIISFLLFIMDLYWSYFPRFLSWNLNWLKTSFLIQAFNSINFPLTTLLAYGTNFNVLFFILIQFEVSPNYPCDFFWTHLFLEVYCLIFKIWVFSSYNSV